jgi:cytochrome c oxidase cbb3-type subunit 3
MYCKLSGYGWVALGAFALIVCSAARAQTSVPDEKPLAQPVIPPLTPPEGLPALIPLGEAAGAYALNLPDDVPNPLHDQPGAVSEGHRRFIEMNCAGCHGYDAAGAMGPNLTDKYWRYGGTPVQVFKSIYEGRPGGMPAWGGALPAQEIWKIVAFVESLGGTFPPDFYHQAREGDQEGELTAPEVMPKVPAAATAPPQAPNPPPPQEPKK